MATHALDGRTAESRTRRYDPAETRARVLDAATALFVARGYVATGTADIARAADVSEGSIFYHFGSKRNLLADLGRTYGEAMVAAMHLPGEAIADIEPGVSIARGFAFCAAGTMYGKIAGSCAEGAREHDPEVAPWIELHIDAVVARRGRSAINPRVAAALTYAAVGEAMHEAMRPGLGDADRAAIAAETVRFVRCACGYEPDGTDPLRA